MIAERSIMVVAVFREAFMPSPTEGPLGQPLLARALVEGRGVAVRLGIEAPRVVEDPPAMDPPAMDLQPLVTEQRPRVMRPPITGAQRVTELPPVMEPQPTIEPLRVTPPPVTERLPVMEPPLVMEELRVMERRLVVEELRVMEHRRATEEAMGRLLATLVVVTLRRAIKNQGARGSKTGRSRCQSALGFLLEARDKFGV